MAPDFVEGMPETNPAVRETAGEQDGAALQTRELVLRTVLGVSWFIQNELRQAPLVIMQRGWSAWRGVRGHQRGIPGWCPWEVDRLVLLPSTFRGGT